jgi:DNA end-binding protein Ku
VRAIWKGFVSFGLVTIPVNVGIAQDRSDPSFRTLVRDTMRPVRQKRWDPDRDVEVAPDETVKGWEYAKGQYVVVEEEDLSAFAPRQEKTVQILQFVELSEVDPIFFEKAYWLEPQERAERPYALLAAALERTGRAALGRFVLSTKEHLVLLRAVDGVLALQTLYYPEDVRTEVREDIRARIGGVEVGGPELEMAEQLVQGMTKGFDPAAYPNETRAAILAMLEARAAGQEPAAPTAAPEAAPVVDLMAALRASLEAARRDDPEALPAGQERAAS